MGTPHKHAALIKAWADGAAIQCKVDGEWIDTDPRWIDYVEYRIKPKSIRYRICLCESEGKYWPVCFSSEVAANDAEKHGTYFVRWLTDWLEVEI